MQGITDAVANTRYVSKYSLLNHQFLIFRFITSPASMASLLGVGILQFIGKMFYILIFFELTNYRNASNMAAVGSIIKCSEKKKKKHSR